MKKDYLFSLINYKKQILFLLTFFVAVCSYSLSANINVFVDLGSYVDETSSMLANVSSGFSQSGSAYLSSDDLKVSDSAETNNNTNYFVDDAVVNLLSHINNNIDVSANRNIYHLFSHGRSGELLINGQWLSGIQLAVWLRANQQINKSTNQLNIYGCNFAKGQKGVEAVAYLEKELGIDIAASTNITGTDGDWKLEYNPNHNKSITLPEYKCNLQLKVYADWSVSGNSGTGTFPGTTLFPDFTWSATGSIQSLVIDGSETFNATNNFETTFGQADNEENLNVRTQVNCSGGGCSGSVISSIVVTTITFNSTMPSGAWGFLIKDIDVEQSIISATDANGNPVPVSVVASWFSEAFDAVAGGGNYVPKWDPSKPAVLGSSTNSGYSVYDNKVIGNLIDNESGTLALIPNIALNSFTFTTENLQMDATPSTHIYIAVSEALIVAGQSISGNVFNDTDGLTDGTVDGTGTNASGVLYATLLDASGDVVASVPVLADGSYSFSGISTGNYTIQISTTDETANIGNSPTTGPFLPSGWSNTGENLGTGAGNDGAVDGMLSVTVASSDITNANFGINQPPSLSITKTHDDADNIVEEGQTVTYTIVVENTGGSDVTNVSVNDILPAGVTYVTSSAEMTYNTTVSGTQTGTYTHNYGTGSFDIGGLTKAFNTSGSIPTGAILTDFSFFTTGSSSDWLSDITLDISYPGGTAYTDAQIGSFGGNGLGSWNKSDGPKTLGGSAEGIYTFVWDDGINGVSGDDNDITTAGFTINYTYLGTVVTTTTDPAGTPPNLVTSGDNITLQPNETLTVTYQVTIDTGASGTLTNSATGDSDETSPVGASSNVSVAIDPCDANLSGLLDTDGDGVSDICDLDDDNDGILDLDEGYCPPGSGSGSGGTTGSSLVDGTFDGGNGSNGICADMGCSWAASWGHYNSNFSGTGWTAGVDGGTAATDETSDIWISPMPTEGSGAWSGLADGMPASPQGGNFIGSRVNLLSPNDASPSGEIVYTNITGLVVGQDYVLKFYQANAGVNGNTALNSTARWAVWFGGNLVGYATPLPYLGEGNQIWYEVTMTLTATATTMELKFQADDYTDDQSHTLISPFTSGYPGGTYIREYMAVDGVELFVAAPACTTLDTDLDGIPDYLDLDSDGDGCPDAIEGSASFVAGDLTSSNIDGGNTDQGDGYNGTVTYPVTDNLGTIVDSDGIPTATGSPQGVGASIDGVQSADCIILPANTTLAEDDVNQTLINTPVDGNIQTNDTDPENDDQDITLIDTNGDGTPDTLPIAGTPITVVNGTIVLDPETGEYTFTPAADFTGTVEIPYETCDDGTPVACDTAILVIDVIGTDTNGLYPPIAVDDNTVTEPDTNVTIPILGNDSDIDGTLDPTSVVLDPTGIGTCDTGTLPDCTVVTIPGEGTYTVQPDGSVIFDPEPLFTGETTPLPYTVCDNDGLCDDATITVVISDPNVNDMTADDDANSGNSGDTLTGNILDNDIDPDGSTGTPDVNGALADTDGDGNVDDVLPIGTATTIYGPDPENPGSYIVAGDLTLNSDGTYSYESDPDFEGTVYIPYEACDNDAMDACDFATLYLTTLIDACLQLDLYVFLEGSLVEPQTGLYNAPPMRTTLNDSRLLPGQFSENPFSGNIYTPALGVSGQVYNVAPWNYLGMEGPKYDSGGTNANPSANYPATVTDWVLVSLRSNPTDGSEALCQRAGLLHSDGHIEFMDDADCCDLDMTQSYYIVIEHRNHLIIMSATAVAPVNGIITYDFRNKQTYINDPFNSGNFIGQKEVLPGIFVMFAGNGDQTSVVTEDTDITAADYSKWLNNGPENRTYNFIDYNMDGDVSALDFNLWQLNSPRFTSVIRD